MGYGGKNQQFLKIQLIVLSATQTPHFGVGRSAPKRRHILK